MALLSPRRLALAGTIALIALLLPGATAQAKNHPPTQAQRVDALMREFAARTQFPPDGVDDPRSIPELVQAYDRGERLNLICGKESYLAVALLQRAGLYGRPVSVLTKREYNGNNDGHSLLEAWTGKRWIVYDPEGNRQPVTKKGRGIGIDALVHSRPFYWKRLASDGPMYGRSKADQAFDSDLYQVAIISATDQRGWLLGMFHDDEQRERIQANFTSLFYVDGASWNACLGPPNSNPLCGYWDLLGYYGIPRS